MKFHFTEIIEDRSPVVVITALERCLKREAWEIKRYDAQVVALGIGTSRNAVNLSDTAKFDIDSSASATTVHVQVEYQYTWFVSEDSQDDTVHARFESVFANMRAELNLAPEWPIRKSEAEEEPTYLSEPTTPSETLITAVESVPLSRPDNGEGETAQQSSASEFEELTAVSPIYERSPRSPRYLLGSSEVPQRLVSGVMSLIVASIIAVTCIVFWASHSKGHPLSGNAPKPVLPVQSARMISSPPDNQPTPLASTSWAKNNSSDSAARATTRSEDPKRWLEQWAASQRTRDAKSQASFYADEVRPYLARPQASRDAVYQNKQDTILNRKGLWTFKIEDVSVRREGANKASVLLKKHFMRQTGSIHVSEQRVPSFLTLKHTQDGWQITGERDLR
jgi:ketosteroid isomerase-like protein